MHPKQSAQPLRGIYIMKLCFVKEGDKTTLHGETLEDDKTNQQGKKNEKVQKDLSYHLGSN